MARSIGLDGGFKGYRVGWQGCQEVLVWVARNIGSGVKVVKGYRVGWQ